MSQSTKGRAGREATPANKTVDLREAGRKGVVTVDLGDVAPTKPTNLNPFETTEPPAAESTPQRPSPDKSANGE